MPKRPVELPDNLPDCHALILRQAERIKTLEARVDELVAELAALRRQLHGSRRGFIPEQPDDDPLPPAPTASSPAEPRRPRTSSGRRPRTIDPTIPREKVYHPLREEDVPAEIWQHPRARRFFSLPFVTISPAGRFGSSTP